MDELDQLVSASRPLAVGGRELELTPLRVGEVPGFARAVAPMANALPLLLAGPEPTAADVLMLLGDHGDAALQAVALASRTPLTWVQGLLPHELLELAAACIEVNADFFRRAQPSLQASGVRLAAAFSAGPTPSRS
jgi:hypothetical protein